MTFPAHRFRDRAERVETRDGQGDGKTFVWDFDETITKCPDRMSHIAAALRAAGDRIVVVTGNTAPRERLVQRLEDYGFPFDDLIQYANDESEGLRRAALLEQLDAWCAFDDRAGRAYTYAKVCPHLFLVAKPSAEAEAAADGAKSDAKNAVKVQVRSAAPPPPNYRPEDTPGECCGSCRMFTPEGLCWGYGNTKVDPDHVCDSWARDQV